MSSWGNQPSSPAGQGSKSTKEGTLGKTGQTEAMEGFQRCRRAAGRMRAGVPGKNAAATERVTAKPGWGSERACLKRGEVRSRD